MDYTKYTPIQVMKKSDKAEVIFAAVDGLDYPVVVKRLFDANPEIYRVISEIENVHIPKIYCVEKLENELFVAEEYVGGKTLDEYLKEDAPEDVKKLEMMTQLCDALMALHTCKPPVIHRDIKPSNIIVTEDGVLKIIDFDASRQYKGEKNTSDTRLLGTIEYAAPEQFGYAQTDFRSDIYSTGVVFSELSMEEKVPFAKDWKRLVDKCTNFSPENRYKNIPELKKDLLKCIQKGKQPNRMRWMIPVVSVAVLTLMVSIGGLQMRKEKEVLQPTPVLEEQQPTSEPDGIVLEEDQISWSEASLPVVIKVSDDESCGIKDVFLCEQTEDDAFSEQISKVSTQHYELSEDKKELRVKAEFFEQYKEAEKIVLYVEFDDGRGERVWLTHTDNEN